MPLFERKDFAPDGADAGVFIDSLGIALTTWVAMQLRPVGVNEAAMTFNTTPDVIREACRDTPYLSVEGDRLELDGV